MAYLKGRRHREKDKAGKKKNPTATNIKNGYMFTNKTRSPFSIMAVVLGAISIVSINLAILFTFLRHGEALLQYGTVLLLCTVFSVIGLGLGVYGRLEKDRFYGMAYVGIGLNTYALICISMILNAGAR